MLSPIHLTLLIPSPTTFVYLAQRYPALSCITRPKRLFSAIPTAGLIFSKFEMVFICYDNCSIRSAMVTISMFAFSLNTPIAFGS